MSTSTPVLKPVGKIVTLNDLPVNRRRFTEADELNLLALTLLETGSLYTINVRFTHKNQGYLRHSKDHIRNTISGWFRKHFPEAVYYFAIECDEYKVEVGKDGGAPFRFHIHGALVAPGLSEDEIKGKLKKICGDKRKLRTETGKDFYKQRGVLIEAHNLFKNYKGYAGIFGWSQYLLKNMSETKKLLSYHYHMEGRIFFASRSLVQLASELHTRHKKGL